MVRTASVYLELAEVRHLIESDAATIRPARTKFSRSRRSASPRIRNFPLKKRKAELTSAQIRERLIKLQDRSDTLSQQLRDLTGVPDSQSLEVEPEEPSLRRRSPGQPSGRFRRCRMILGLRKRKTSARRASNSSRARRQSYWPTVDAVGQYSVFSKLNNYDLYYKTFQRNNFNVGNRSHDPALCREDFRERCACQEPTQRSGSLCSATSAQQVRLESCRIRARPGSSKPPGKSLRLDLKLAQQTLELAQAKLEDGKATLKDVEQSRLEESDKWMAFLDANLAWQRAQLKVLQATGQLAKVLQ